MRHPARGVGSVVQRDILSEGVRSMVGRDTPPEGVRSVDASVRRRGGQAEDRLMSESVLPACWSGGSDPPAPRPGASAPCDRGCCTSARRSVRGSSGARVGPVPPVAVRCPAPRRSAGTEGRRRLGMLPRRPCPRIPVRGPPPAAPGGDGQRSFAAGCGPRRWGTPRGPRPPPMALRRMCRGARVRRRGTSAPDVVPRGAPPPIGGKGVGKGPPPAAPGWEGTRSLR